MPCCPSSEGCYTQPAGSMTVALSAELWTLVPAPDAGRVQSLGPSADGSGVTAGTARVGPAEIDGELASVGCVVPHAAAQQKTTTAIVTTALANRDGHRPVGS